MARLRQHPWRRRLLGLTLGCFIVIACEVLCRILGLGQPDPNMDPFVSFEGTRPLFTVDPVTNTHVTASERLKFFVEDRFPRRKSENTYRIFCLGGSTVQGRPYSIETAFSAWLRLGLETAYPDRRFDVVNCGGVSYASYRLIPILQECLAYEPDLFIVCTGQNEFLEERSYRQAKRWRWLYGTASKSRLYHLLKGLTAKDDDSQGSRPILKQEVDALLDYRGGLQAYHRDDILVSGVKDHYRQNIDRLITISKTASVPVLFLRPPVNVKDCPPFKSLSSHSGTNREIQEARKHYQTNKNEAIKRLHDVVQRDPRCASAHYELGQVYLSQADYHNAQHHLSTAMREDLCQLRILPEMADALFSICRRRGVPCLDIQSLLGKECPQGLVGQEILVDHVHPSIRGHQIIAAHVQHHLKSTLGPPAEAWDERRKSRFQEHLDSLDALYYAHGQQRLRNLHLWTQGRTDGPPLNYREP